MADPIADNAELAVDELKRKARRRLIGAIVLALAAATLLPLLLEQEQKPLGDDVSVQIPPVDEGKFVSRLPGEKGKDAPPEPRTDTRADAKREVRPEAKADVKSETKADVRPETRADAKAEPKAEALPEPQAEGRPAPKADARPEPKAEAKPAPKTDAKPAPKADAKPAPKASAKPEPKTGANPEPKADANPDARAEPVSAAAPETSAAPIVAEAAPSEPNAATAAAAAAGAPDGERPKTDGYIVQLGAFTDAYGANALSSKLRKAGYPAFTEPIETSRGTLWRVRVGGYPSRAAAVQARNRLKADGHNGIVSAGK